MAQRTRFSMRNKNKLLSLRPCGFAREVDFYGANQPVNGPPVDKKDAANPFGLRPGLRPDTANLIADLLYALIDPRVRYR